MIQVKTEPTILRFIGLHHCQRIFSFTWANVVSLSIHLISHETIDQWDWYIMWWLGYRGGILFIKCHIESTGPVNIKILMICAERVHRKSLFSAILKNYWSCQDICYTKHKRTRKTLWYACVHKIEIYSLSNSVVKADNRHNLLILTY